MNEINLFETRLSTRTLLWPVFVFTGIGIVALYPNGGIENFVLYILSVASIVMLIEIFLKSKVEVTEKYIRIKYNFLLFFLKPIEIRLGEIELIKISNTRGKGIYPFLKISYNNGKKNTTYYLTNFISEKSIDELQKYLNSLKIKTEYGIFKSGR